MNLLATYRLIISVQAAVRVVAAERLGYWSLPQAKCMAMG